ncbi:hypothetical protein ABZ135_32785 [Streptomyces sp. NPDC006339]|uniref:hypothetical protein n=1 Tax=Streptomyces sp. NPDC006339 TaxID=3156755 RepID=UPI00339EFC33
MTPEPQRAAITPAQIRTALAYIKAVWTDDHDEILYLEDRRPGEVPIKHLLVAFAEPLVRGGAGLMTADESRRDAPGAGPDYAVAMSNVLIGTLRRWAATEDLEAAPGIARSIGHYLLATTANDSDLLPLLKQLRQVMAPGES